MSFGSMYIFLDIFRIGITIDKDTVLLTDLYFTTVTGMLNTFKMFMVLYYLEPTFHGSRYILLIFSFFETEFHSCYPDWSAMT